MKIPLKGEEKREGNEKEEIKRITRTKNIGKNIEIDRSPKNEKDRERKKPRSTDPNLNPQVGMSLKSEEPSSTSGTKISINDRFEPIKMNQSDKNYSTQKNPSLLFFKLLPKARWYFRGLSILFWPLPVFHKRFMNHFIWQMKYSL